MTGLPASHRFTALGTTVVARRPDAGLHLVATPIGNLRDITIRALEVLAGADLVLAEDTRVTRGLFHHFGIATPLSSYHEHNADEMRPRILARLAAGEVLALVSDAGTPLVSDPGYRLVRDCVEAGHRVQAVPGASSLLAGLVVAGLPTDRFFFEGFLPEKSAARRARLKEMETIPGTLVMFEAPRRLAGLLDDALAMLGDRPAAIGRELTKLHETVYRGTLASLAADFADDPETRGEAVVLIGAADAATTNAGLSSDLATQLAAALGETSLKEAVARVTAATGLPRRQVYAKALELTRDVAP
jgi:16S rRNA (cytidine1402-2'-O)-methyltransferase